MPLRVLHVIAALAASHGGPSKVAVELCESLAARGAQVTLFATNLDEMGRWSPFGSPVLIDVPTDRSIVINDVERRYFDPSWPSRFAYSPELGRSLRDRIAEFDVVHVHSLYQFTTLATCHHARRREVPYIVRPHGTLDPYQRRRHALRKLIYDRVLQRSQLDHAAAVHFTSQEELELARSVGIRAPGVVVPLGVNLTEFEGAPPPGSFKALHPELEGKRLVVFLGRVTQKKGLDLLVPAFAAVAREFGDAHLVIAGPDNDGLGKSVWRWLSERGLERRATMVGMLLGREKLALLADAAVWVLPSYAENFAMAAVEAMASGAPVVISDRVNIQKDVRRAGAGLVVACDPSAISTAICRILDDSELEARLRGAGRRLVEERFTWDAAARRLMEVYGGVVGAREGGLQWVG